MAAPKEGEAIVSGQVPVEVAEYIKAFAKAKGSSVSKQVAMILEDWHHKRGVFTEVDRAAHKIAEESASYASNAPPKSNAPRKTG